VQHRAHAQPEQPHGNHERRRRMLEDLEEFHFAVGGQRLAVNKKPHRSAASCRGRRLPRAARRIPPQIAWPILKIGRYMATTMPPMRPPSTTMIIGSINDESDSTASS